MTSRFPIKTINSMETRIANVEDSLNTLNFSDNTITANTIDTTNLTVTTTSSLSGNTTVNLNSSTFNVTGTSGTVDILSGTATGTVTIGNAHSTPTPILLGGITNMYCNMITVSETTTLTSAQSGSVVLLTGDYTINLPAAQTGVYFKIITTANSSGSQIINFNTENGTFSGFSYSAAGIAQIWDDRYASPNGAHPCAYTYNTAMSHIILSSGTYAGAIMEFYSTGSTWFGHGSAFSAEVDVNSGLFILS